MTIYVKREQVAAILNATFPDYRGNKIKVDPRKSVTFSDLNWSGGTRSQYRACDVSEQSLGNMDRYNQIAPWHNPAEGASVELPANTAIVMHTIFLGKDFGLTIYIHPDNMPTLLPAPVVLTQLERLILLYTAHRKSSYMGKDRYAMAHEDAHWGCDDTAKCGYTKDGHFPSREAWNTVKVILITKGLLNKAGVITNAGRNAI